jgi:hypothetical protein
LDRSLALDADTLKPPKHLLGNSIRPNCDDARAERALITFTLAPAMDVAMNNRRVAINRMPS